MPEPQSFADLLAAAPAAEGEGNLSVTGTLARSADKAKFVLTLGTGESVTLDVDAVTNHQVLGGSTGRTIVRLDLDPAKVPPELAFGPLAKLVHGTGAAHDATVSHTDQHTFFGVDAGPTGPDPSSPDTVFGADATRAADVAASSYAYGAYVPFGLAIPHRSATAATMAAQINARINGSKIFEDRKNLHDHGKDPFSDTVPPHHDI
jgi:hypothetical protein